MGTPVASSVTVPWMAPVVVVCPLAVEAKSNPASPRQPTAKKFLKRMLISPLACADDKHYLLGSETFTELS
jgi:hypothetical protein